MDGIKSVQPLEVIVIESASQLVAVLDAVTPKSFKAEVIADNSGEWCSNALRFATETEAKSYGKDLSGRWMAVRQWRVAESDEPVTCTWDAAKYKATAIPADTDNGL
jgi:hypothetical protein